MSTKLSKAFFFIRPNRLVRFSFCAAILATSSVVITGCGGGSGSQFEPMSELLAEPAAMSGEMDIDPDVNEQGTAVEGDALVQSRVPRLEWPTDRGAKIALGYGADWLDNGCDGKKKRHTAIDIKVGKGRPVYAGEAGKVVVVGSDPTWKGWVTIEHSSGGKFTTVYWHISPSVKTGQAVSRGQKIGVVADMGSNTHLHFGVRDAAYSNTANRGALPRNKACGTSDPQFPERFKNPLDFTSP
jgi:murein DD-endopeptidase MepM/ murein hydrolase activator NlpD